MSSSAAEKLAQRDDLEAILQQLETESEANAHDELPSVRVKLQLALAAAYFLRDAAADDDAVSSGGLDEAIAIACAELGDAVAEGMRDGEACECTSGCRFGRLEQSGSRTGATHARP